MGKKIYCDFVSKGVEVPYLQYSSFGFDHKLEVYPHFTYFIGDEVDRMQKSGSYPLLDFGSETLDQFYQLEMGKVNYIPRVSEWWKAHHKKAKSAIRKWLSYLPEEVLETFQPWFRESAYYWKAIQYSCKYKMYLQLCQSNPALAFLLIQRKEWRKDHPLAKKRFHHVLDQKQSVLAEILGFEREDWKILKKFRPESIRRSFLVTLRDLLKVKKIRGILSQLDSFDEMCLAFLYELNYRNYLDKLEPSFVIDINNNYKHIDPRILSKKANVSIPYGDYYSKYHLGEHISYLWRECTEHNSNWRIKTEKSLFRHEQIMIQELNQLDESTVIKEMKQYGNSPVPWEGWVSQTYPKVFVEPIRNSHELFLVGQRMRNCAYSYRDQLEKSKCMYRMLIDDSEFLLYLVAVFFDGRLRNPLHFYVPSPVEVDLNDPNQEWEDVAGSTWIVREFKGRANSRPTQLAIDCAKEWFAWARKVGNGEFYRYEPE